MSLAKMAVVTFAFSGLMTFSMIALLSGNLIMIVLSGASWIATLVFYVWNHKHQAAELERFEEEMRQESRQRSR